MRRLLSLIACLMVGLGLVGCATQGQASHSSDSEDALTIMANASNVNNPYIQRIFDLYEEKTGKELNVIAVDNESYNEQVKDALASDDAPDIVMLFNNVLMSEVGGTEQFVDLSDQPWVSDLEESALAYSSGDSGELLGLPFWESSVSGTYYNKRMLEEVGLRPATNQAEFDRLCAALASIGYTPIALGDDGCYSYYQFGLDPIVADNPEILEALNSGELVYSEIPQVVSMVNWFKKAHDAGWFGTTTEIPYEELGAAMGNGEAAMVFSWSTWFDTDFEPGTYTAEDFGLMPVFIGTEDGGTFEGGNLNLFAVNKESGKTSEALEFLEFCATPENYNVAFDGIATNRVFKGQTTNVESPMVLEVQDELAQKERVSTAEPKIKGYDARAINEAMHRLYAGEITVEECLAEMDASLG